MSVRELTGAPPARERAPLGEAVARANRLISASARNLTFRIDQDTGKPVVQVIDAQSGTLLRQIPSEEMLAIAKALDRMQGLMINLKV